MFTSFFVLALWLGLHSRGGGRGGNGGDGDGDGGNGSRGGDTGSRSSVTPASNVADNTSNAQQLAANARPSGQGNTGTLNSTQNPGPYTDQNPGPSGDREGQREVVIHRPNDPNPITDIDRFENGILWEEKTATGAKNSSTWIAKHIEGKVAKYIEARQNIDGYNDAPIGIQFTKSGVDPAFKAEVEAEVARLRQENPDIPIHLEWPE